MFTRNAAPARRPDIESSPAHRIVRPWRLTRRTLSVALAAVAGVVLLAPAMAIVVWRRQAGDAVRALTTESTESSGEATALAAAALPPAVQRYLDFAGADAPGPAQVLRIQWAGEFRTSPDGEWLPFTAVQHVTTRRPGFVWDARIRMAPLIPVLVRDEYRQGRGSTLARLGGLLTVAREQGSGETAQSALGRWLGESVWYPAALRPDAALRWEPVSPDAAKATIDDGETSASATFHFAEDGRVTRVDLMRYRQNDDGSALTPFHAAVGDYRRVGPTVVPGRGEASWTLPDGEFTFWRAELVGIEVLRVAD